MIIIEDSRETSPLLFTSDKIEYVMKSKLNFGDYACVIDNKWCPIVFERKSLADLFGTLGKGHSRFRKEINRSIEQGSQLVIIVEKPLKTIVKGHPRSQMKGIAVVRTLFTLMLKHHIPFVLCTSKEEMALWITECFYGWSKLNGK